VDDKERVVVRGSSLATHAARSRIGLVNGPCVASPTFLADPALFTVDTVASNATQVVFTTTLPTGTAPGVYSLCGCLVADNAAGNPCQGRGYVDHVGVATVTARIELHRDYVFDLPSNQSLDIRGRGLSLRDRIMVISAYGTCGATSPTSHLIQPVHDNTAVPFNEFSPVSVERPATAPAADNPMARFTAENNKYCRGANLGPTELGEAAADLCAGKCAGGDCVGQGCYCDGLFNQVDEAHSDLCPESALCLPRDECIRVCDGLPGCGSVDMHETKPRCHLNSGICDLPVVDNSYTLYVKTGVPETVGGVPADITLLRFHPVQFDSAGTYKVCVCDSAVAPCTSISNYNVEVGHVHVSGVTCLVEQERFRRRSCYNQEEGGISCGRDE